MKVYFIGAGPGDPDLITVKGRRIIEACKVCLYAGSLVPEAVVQYAPEGALVRDTAPMHLDEILALILDARSRNLDVARVHSGDPSLYGAIAEQIRRLRKEGIEYEIIPGVPAFCAAAAVLGQELTIPEVAQSVVLTRTTMKSSAMPANEELGVFGKSGATLAIHLSVRNSLAIQRQLMPLYGEDCPAIVAYRIGWPDQLIIRTKLVSLREQIREHKLTRTALVLVGRALEEQDFRDSALYDSGHRHILRPRASTSSAKQTPDKSGARMNR